MGYAPDTTFGDARESVIIDFLGVRQHTIRQVFVAERKTSFFVEFRLSPLRSTS